MKALDLIALLSQNPNAEVLVRIDEIDSTITFEPADPLLFGFASAEVDVPYVGDPRVVLVTDPQPRR